MTETGHKMDDQQGDLDEVLTFALHRSVVHDGYDLIVRATRGAITTIGKVPTAEAGLQAIVSSLTAPLADADRLAALEDSVGAINDLLDRVTELEGQYAAILEQTSTTRDAVMNLLAGGKIVSPGPAESTDRAVRRPVPRSTSVTPVVNLRDQGTLVEEGFAGRFKETLADAKARGAFPGGAFGRGGPAAPTGDQE